MSDPVAAKSSFLCMYMSSHPDTLVSYVKYWGKVQDHVVSAQMTSIDTKGMNLTYTTKMAGDSKKGVRIAFEPPLSGYEEVKPRLMNMKADAEESLGVTRVPQITSFRLPSNIYIPTALVSSLMYLAYAPLPSSSAYSSVFFVANFVRTYLPEWLLEFTWYFLVFIHVMESLYTFSLCRKHTTGVAVGAQYILATLIFGFPIWTDMRRQVQTARIDSIMKGQ